MEIVGNKALRFTTHKPHKIAEFIPKSKVVGEDSVVVHWGLDECMVLTALSTTR